MIRAETDLRLDPEAIASDTEDFREAVLRGDWSAAYQLYQGPFAAGFSLEDSPEFDRWLEDERATLKRQAESDLIRVRARLSALVARNGR